MASPARPNYHRALYDSAQEREMYEPCLIVVAAASLEDRRELMTILTNLGLDPICASAVQPCRELIMRESIDLVFCDRLFPDGDYRDVLAASSCAKAKPNVVL